MIRLQEETAKVEEHLLEDRTDGYSFTDAIVKCVTIAKANAFENLLEPLQKLLRLSPPIAATLARVDLFTRIGQKLHHPKAAVRLNLLRILSSICDSSEEQGDLLARYGLLDAIRELESDPAILVRDMAGKLVKSSEQSARRRPLMRRSSISTASQNLIPSRPSTPQANRSGQSKGFLEVRETPRHLRNGPSLRPESRDGSSSSSMMSGGNGGFAGRSRVPRRLSNRMSQIGFHPSDEPRSPSVPTRPSSVMPSRRRRQTNDLQWS